MNRSFEKCYFRVMKRIRVFLIIALLCGLACAENFEFFHYLQASQNPDYPYSIDVGNPGKKPLEISTKHELSKLTPLTQGLGRETLASIHFAADVASTLVLPAQQTNNNTPLNFRIETDAPVGVYNLVLEFPGWKPNMHPIALNTNLKFSTAPRLSNRYLYVGDPRNQYLLGDKALSPEQLNGSIFTLIALDASKATFTVENLKGNVTIEFDSGKSFPGLALIIPDPTIDVLSQKYVGKKVWHFGGFALTCFPAANVQVSYQGNMDSHARVKRILRLVIPSELHLTGGYGQGNAFMSSGDFVVVTPLAIQFEDTQGLTKSMVGSLGDNLDGLSLFENSNCNRFIELDADPWQLERLFSLTPASPRVPREYSSLIGLDRWQMAWLWGFPSVNFGTRAELMKLPEWQYENIPFPKSVFFSKDHVMKVEISRLP